MKIHHALLSAVLLAGCGEGPALTGDANSTSSYGDCANAKQLGTWVINGTYPYNYQVEIAANCHIFDQQCNQVMILHLDHASSVLFSIEVKEPPEASGCLSLGTHSCQLIVGLAEVMQVKCDDGIVRNYTRAE